MLYNAGSLWLFITVSLDRHAAVLNMPSRSAATTSRQEEEKEEEGGRGLEGELGQSSATLPASLVM